MVKLTILTWRYYPGLSGWVLKPIRNVPTTERQREKATGTGVVATVKRCRQQPEAGRVREQILPSGLQRVGPANTLMLAQ